VFFVLQYSGYSGFSKGVNRLLFAFENLEDGYQFRDLQQIANSLGQIRQLDGASGIASRGVKGNQGPEAAAINVIDAAEIKDDTTILGDEGANGVAQGSGFFAEDNASGAIHDQNAI
jgi:hypothetical protein